MSIRPYESNGVSKSGPTVENITDAFSSILYEMTIQPGNVNDSMKPVVDMLHNCSDERAVNNIVEILFEQVCSVLTPGEKFTIRYWQCKHIHIQMFVFCPTNLLIVCTKH